MGYTSVDCKLFDTMLKNGYRHLYAVREKIDELNVFPVPDGDTGLNMSMTMRGGVDGIKAESSVGEYMKKVAHGALFSARGNSGVILSQFISGFAKGVEAKQVLGLQDFAAGMKAGVDQAYTSVATPVEGTMLTVMRESYEYINDRIDSISSIEDCFDKLVFAMERSLENTPNLLEVLKEAGVVDSGGAGFLAVFQGMKMALEGNILDENSDVSLNITKTSDNKAHTLEDNGKMDYGYCTEFILQLMFSDSRGEEFDLDEMINTLSSMGDSIVAIRDDNIVKVHVHAYKPEQVLSYAHKFGEFLTLKIENMALQHNEILHKKEKAKKHKKYAVAAVLSGDGISAYFAGIGADAIISGGQTDNPSTEDFIKAFDEIDADHIVVLPNNSNVIMAAKQAASIYKKCDVRIIPTHSIAEGYSALSMMDNSADSVEEMIEGMSYGLKNVTSAYVTTATRDTTLNGINIKKGNYIGLDNETVRSASSDKFNAIFKLLENLPDIDDKEVLTAFYGNGVDEDEAGLLQEKLEEKFPMLESGFIRGDQPVYDYIFAVE